MTMNRLNRPNPIIGDDYPYNTIALRDAPTGFHFVNLIPDPSLTMTYEMWDELVGYAERFYADWELNARTLVDWMNGLQLSYDTNKYKFEKALVALANVRFEEGQTTTHTLQQSDVNNTVRSKSSSADENTTGTDMGSDSKTVRRDTSDSTERDYQGTTANGQEATADEINVAFDSTNTDPTKRTNTVQNQNEATAGSEATDTNVTEDVSESNQYGKSNTLQTERAGTEDETANGSSMQTVTETTVTDRFQGEEPLDYYKRLMEQYPNIFTLFTDMFKEDFLIHEVLIW